MRERKEKKKRTSLFLTVDTDIYEKFELIIKKKYINKSHLIDGLITDWIKNNEL